jgi:DNA-binding response OmpR family regulator
MPNSPSALDPTLLRKTRGSKRILVVDDEKDIVTLLKLQLKAHGYQVSTAYDGLQALEKVAEDKPDLVVLDIMMPKVDGWVVCHSVKGNRSTRNTRVIILTAQAQFMAKIKGLYIMQADIYMSKPYDDKELVSNADVLLNIEEEAKSLVSTPQQATS